MSLRSLLTTGLLAAGVVASPPGYGNTKTVTKTVTPKPHTVTVTHTASCKVSTSHSTSHSSSHSTSHSTTKVSTSSTKASSSTKVSSSTSSPSGTSSSITSSSASSVSTTSSSSVNTVPTTTILATATATGYGLNDAAKAAGKLWFGTAADIPGTGEAQDPYYIAEFNNIHDFGEATPANIMKYEFTEPEPGVFNYTGAEQFLAAAAGKAIRCHNLIWSQELPTFITAPTVPWTNATLTAALVRHVTNVVTYFGDRCYSWDVVNEAFADGSPVGTYSSNIWLETIGPAYVVEAFQAASDAVKAGGFSTKLYYNDYNIENPGNKSTTAQNLVKDLKNRGITIDGIGLESHFIVSCAFTNLQSTY